MEGANNITDVQTMVFLTTGATKGFATIVSTISHAEAVAMAATLEGATVLDEGEGMTVGAMTDGRRAAILEFLNIALATLRTTRRREVARVLGPVRLGALKMTEVPRTVDGTSEEEEVFTTLEATLGHGRLEATHLVTQIVQRTTSITTFAGEVFGDGILLRGATPRT